jgi:quercetin dioxygenase-like cupin family protein
MTGRRSAAALSALAALALLAGISGGAGEAQEGEKGSEVGSKTGAGVKAAPVFGAALPNVPGKRLTAVVVDYAPGSASPVHHHAGSVFVHVLAGAVRSQVTGGPVTVYRAGESFFEPPGGQHLVSENASATEPARLLAVFVADEGATLTVNDR